MKNFIHIRLWNFLINNSNYKTMQNSKNRTKEEIEKGKLLKNKGLGRNLELKGSCLTLF